MWPRYMDFEKWTKFAIVCNIAKLFMLRIQYKMKHSSMYSWFATARFSKTKTFTTHTNTHTSSPNTSQTSELQIPFPNTVFPVEKCSNFSKLSSSLFVARRKCTALDAFRHTPTHTNTQSKPEDMNTYVSERGFSCGKMFKLFQTFLYTFFVARCICATLDAFRLNSEVRRPFFFGPVLLFVCGTLRLAH